MAEQPGKLFYKIGEVSRLAQVEPYILRYWENEFPALSPKKSRGGQRVYRQKDLDLVLSIKKMLYEEGYTIAGARKIISKGGPGGRTAGKTAGNLTEMPEPGNMEAIEEMEAEAAAKQSRSIVAGEINNSPQMSLLFSSGGGSSGIQDVLLKVKAEIKEIIELVK